MINNKIIYSIVMLLMGLHVQAQVVLSDKNYVHTTVPQTAVKIADMENVSCANANDVDNTIESVTYYDGLGRPIQQRAIKASPTGKDIVTHMQYDAYGRQDKQYLPFEANNTVGSYKTVDVNTDINAYYKNTYSDDFPGITTNLGDVNAYSESVFEASPLNRVTEQGAPGKAWKADPNSDTDHTIKFDWGTNTTNEVMNFTVSFTGGDTEKPELVQNNHYAADQLYVTITKDENWTPTDGDLHTTREYKDKQGRVVLKRTYASTPSATSEVHDTYYVYDRFGNLTYVIPPKVITADGVSNTELSELCYQYTYDYRNRLIEKKIPGKGWEYIIYNTLDQPVLTQDANLRAKSRWLFTKYDAFGRVVYTGIIENGSTVALLRSRVSSSTYETYETKTTSPITIAGTPVYYTKDAYPVSIHKVLTINYYDDYSFDIDGLTNPGTVYGEAIDTSTKSLPTGSKVRILGTNDWITSVIYYDGKSRPIFVASKNKYLNTTDIIESKLDFVSKIEETKTTHIKGDNAAIITVDKLEYDHMGRLLSQTQQINTQDKEQIVSNTYDAFGQLKRKDIGGAVTENTNQAISTLQNIDYSYNIRGWFTGINNVNTIGNDLFAFGINYNSTTEGLGAEPLYNGNISEILWKTANDNTKRAYGYRYDKLNRIIEGRSNDGRYNLSNISYDKMGNILRLQRTGAIVENIDPTKSEHFGVMDNLGYSYDTGNKLLKVTELPTGNGAFGFKDGNNTGNDFAYDINGNLTIDNNKNISGILYNHLNLPTRVNFNGGTEYINYVYDANGIKLKKIATTNNGKIFTEYVGNYIYKNGALEFFNHSEGIVEPEADGYKYVYQFKDHLGNIRLSYKDADKNGSISQSEIIEEKNYYPFGMIHSGYNFVVNGREHTYGFGNKEENNELGLEWLDFGARNYDNTIGRWMNIDNLAENSIDLTPYHYANNNPIIFVDPDGQDWFYYRQEGNEEASWNWHDGSEHTVQIGDVDGSPLKITLQGVAAVVVFNGSRSEKKGAGSNINGAGAVTAEITVYGPGGADDVSTYTGYSLTSDADSRTPIDEGTYSVKRRNSAGSGSLPKHYQLFENGADNIRTMDGVINANAPSQLRDNGEGYKNAIFLHRTNNSGGMAGTVSTGCLLIAPGDDWDNFDNQLSPLGNALDNEANSRAFTLILNRTGSDHNPSKAAPVETTKTIFNLNLGKR